MTIALDQPTGRFTRPKAPGPKMVPVLGLIRAARRDPLEFFTRMAREHGSVVRFEAGLQPLHLLSSADHIAHVLVQNHTNYVKSAYYDKVRPIFGAGMFVVNGEDWKRKREFAQPAFKRHKFDSLAEAMADCTADMLDRWEGARNTGMPLDVAAEMMQLSLRIVFRAFFGTDFQGRMNNVTEALTVIMQEGEKRIWALASAPNWLPTARNRRLREALRVFDECIYDLIEQRRREGATGDDLLSMLVAMNMDSGEAAISDREMRDDLMTLIIAGHETTAMAVSWSWYLLSRDGFAAGALREEAQRVLGDRQPNAADLRELTYAKQVVQEAMRLYPPFWTISRMAVKDDEIDGYRIPAKSTVMLCPYVTHRDPEVWDNPDKFDPDRFSTARSAGRPRFAYFPFGGGPRICIGANFAMMEATFVVAMAAQRFRMRLVPGQDVAPQPMISLRPRNGLLMTLH